MLWDEREIIQCINLSLADMERSEPLLIVASYLWSNTMNAFLFSHEPMTPTLADVLMLTGLNISGPVTPFHLLDQVLLEDGQSTSPLIPRLDM